MGNEDLYLAELSFKTDSDSLHRWTYVENALIQPTEQQTSCVTQSKKGQSDKGRVLKFGSGLFPRRTLLPGGYRVVGFQSANSLRFPASFCAPYHDIGTGPKAMGSDLCGLKTWDKKNFSLEAMMLNIH